MIKIEIFLWKIARLSIWYLSAMGAAARRRGALGRFYKRLCELLADKRKAPPQQLPQFDGKYLIR